MYGKGGGVFNVSQGNVRGRKGEEGRDVRQDVRVMLRVREGSGVGNSLIR